MIRLLIYPDYYKEVMMLKLNKTTDYAIRVVVFLRKTGQWKTKIEISEEMGIPRKYLQAVLDKLREAGIVDSTRGINGGYTLKKEWYDIKLIDIIKTTEAAVNINTFNDTEDINTKQLKSYLPVQSYFDKVQNEIEANLSVTIQDIVNNY